MIGEHRNCSGECVETPCMASLRIRRNEGSPLVLSSIPVIFTYINPNTTKTKECTNPKPLSKKP